MTTAATHSTRAAAFNGTSVAVDYPSYLAQHEVVYLAPPRDGYQAMPIGDGDMAASVWCPAGELRLQVNKSDLWWQNPYRARLKACDHQLLSAGSISIRTDPSPLDDPTRFEQRLNLYSASVSVEADAACGGCQANIWTAAGAGLLCVDFQDSLIRSRSRVVELHGLRNSRAFALDGHIGVVEALPDRRYALVCRLVGAVPEVNWKSAQTPTFEVSCARGTGFTLIATVAVTDRDGDPITVAKARLASALDVGLEEIGARHRRHWHAFWQKSLLRLESRDGLAEYLENLWYLYLYQLGCTSDKRPPIPRGGLWLTGEETMSDGAVYRLRETSALYGPTIAANHAELSNGFFDLVDSARKAAEQALQNGTRTAALAFPTVVSRHGDEPDETPPPQRASDAAIGLAVAAVACERWRATQDAAFLRDRAAPLIRTVAAHYLAKVERMLSAAEPETPADIRGVCARAGVDREDVDMLAEILAEMVRCGVDLQLDEAAGRALDTIVKLRRPADRDYAAAGGDGLAADGDGPAGDDAVARLRRIRASANESDVWMTPVAASRLCLPDDVVGSLSDLVAEHQAFPQGFFAGAPAFRVPSDDPLPYLHFGAAVATTLNNMCFQERNGVLHLFPSLPEGWDGTFSLRAGGGLLIMAQIVDRQVVWAAIESQQATRCRVANPWTGEARVWFGRRPIVRTDGPLLEFNTEAGGLYVLDRVDRPLARMVRLRITGRRSLHPRRYLTRMIGIG